MIVLGLTGGIATGKSTVLQALAELGAHTHSADALARQITEKGSPVVDRITAHFGRQVLKEDGSLNRAALGEIVFANPQKRVALEEITHPVIKERLREWIARQVEERPKGSVIVVETPLLFEARMEAWFDRIVVVRSDARVRIGRIKVRSGLTQQEAESRLAAQMPNEAQAERADWVIENNGSLESLRRQVEHLWSETVTISSDGAFKSRWEQNRSLV